MPVFGYHDFKTHLVDLQKDAKGTAMAAVYWLYGEEMLCKSILTHLVDRLLPGSARAFGYEPINGLSVNLSEAIQKLNTYSLLNSRKVVAFLDADLLHGKGDYRKLLEKARQAFDAEKMDKAADHLLSVLCVLELSFEDLQHEQGLKDLGLLDEGAGDVSWLSDVLRYCRKKGRTIPPPMDAAAQLQSALKSGFPPRHHLILTTDSVDKRRQLYKMIVKQGIVVDCSVPSGARKQDRAAREAMLKEVVNDCLGAANKRILPSAYRLLLERTGFDLRTLDHNLAKLMNYVADRTEIREADVAQVVNRTKTDPIYEFTDALTDRHTPKALFYLNTLLADGVHPLQVMAAMVNQIRKLLLADDFVKTRLERPDRRGWSYPYFQQRIMPLIRDYDQDEPFRKRVDDRTVGSHGTSSDAAAGRQIKSGGKKRGAPSKSDLLLAPNPRNPYPVFKLFEKASRFSKPHLVNALQRLQYTDGLLKRSTHSPKLLLEMAVTAICQNRFAESQDSAPMASPGLHIGDGDGAIEKGMHGGKRTHARVYP